MSNTNIWLKELELSDGKEYCDLLIELANYEGVYARPVPNDFTFDEFDSFKRARVKMSKGEDLPTYVMPTNTYWVMDGEIPIGYATLKHKVDENKPGGHIGLCLKNDYQNRGIGTIVTDQLSIIAYQDLGLEKIIYTSKNENIQSQKSIDKIGATLVSIHDGYHFYELDLVKKMEILKEGRFK